MASEELVMKRYADLDGSQESIESVSLYVQHYHKHVELWVECWIKAFDLYREMPEKKLALIYLANDVCQKSKHKKESIVTAFQKPILYAINNIARDKKLKEKIERCINIWDERKIFNSKEIKVFRSALDHHNFNNKTLNDLDIGITTAEAFPGNKNSASEEENLDNRSSELLAMLSDSISDDERRDLKIKRRKVTIEDDQKPGPSNIAHNLKRPNLPRPQSVDIIPSMYDLDEEVFDSFDPEDFLDDITSYDEVLNKCRRGISILDAEKQAIEATLKTSIKDSSEANKIFEDIAKNKERINKLRESTGQAKTAFHKELLLSVNLARKFFGQQCNDCKVVLDAYAEYAMQVDKVLTGIEENERAGLYTPPTDAPSPTANDEIEFQDDSGKLRANVTPSSSLMKQSQQSQPVNEGDDYMEMDDPNENQTDDGPPGLESTLIQPHGGFIVHPPEDPRKRRQMVNTSLLPANLIPTNMPVPNGSGSCSSISPPLPSTNTNRLTEQYVSRDDRNQRDSYDRERSNGESWRRRDREDQRNNSGDRYRRYRYRSGEDDRGNYRRKNNRRDR